MGKKFYGIEVAWRSDTGIARVTTLAGLYTSPPDRQEIDRRIADWRDRVWAQHREGKIPGYVGMIQDARVVDFFLLPGPSLWGRSLRWLSSLKHKARKL